MDLSQQKESLIQQRDNAYAVYQQSIGAIALIDHLLEEQERSKSMTVDEFKEAIGAQSAEIVEH